MNSQSIWNKRIPSIFGIILLIVGVGVTGWLIQTGVIFTGRAAPGNTPLEVTVSNITDRSFTVSYRTTDTVIGTLSYGEGRGEKTIAVDEQDQLTGKPQPRMTHFITVKNLKPKTQYSFSINSGGKEFSDNGKNYTLATAERLNTPLSDNPLISGKITTVNGKPPTAAIAYLTAEGGQVLSTQVRPDGVYSIPTDTLRNTALTAYLPLEETTRIRIRIVSPDGTSEIAALARATDSLPVITLSKQYDFTIARDPRTTIASSGSATVIFPEFDGTTEDAPVSSVQITTPKKGQSLSDQRPTIRGKAPPNTEVEIQINADDPIQANVIADRRGNWSYRPKSPLGAGELDVTATARDASGIAKTFTQSFTVLSSGSQFTEPSVSPSAPTRTPTPTRPNPTPTTASAPTPTRASSPSPTRTPTPRNTSPAPTQSVVTPTTSKSTPTLIPVSPTPTITVTQPVATLIPTTPISLSPRPSIAPTGNTDGILYALIGAIALTIGAALLLLTGGMPL